MVPVLRSFAVIEEVARALTTSLTSSSGRLALALFFSLTLGGCKAPGDDPRSESFVGPIYFWHNFHRKSIGLTDESIRRLRFYVDREIILKSTGDDYRSIAVDGRLVEVKTDLIREVVIPASTPGRVRSVGPASIELQFSDDLSLEFSVAGDRRAEGWDSAYFLNAFNSSVDFKGKKYRIQKGGDARLLVDVDFTNAIDAEQLVIRGLDQPGAEAVARTAN